MRYIFLLHQTTTSSAVSVPADCCVISFFYIKPQLVGGNSPTGDVALYLSSTSNHNAAHKDVEISQVALYLSSTSNHNSRAERLLATRVALYLSSTSNHNFKRNPFAYHHSCVISFFYIKPQPSFRLQTGD